MPREIKQIIYKCDGVCPFFDELDGIQYCIHPFNEYEVIKVDKDFSDDCPLEIPVNNCYK